VNYRNEILRLTSLPPPPFSTHSSLQHQRRPKHAKEGKTPTTRTSFSFSSPPPPPRFKFPDKNAVGAMASAKGRNDHESLNLIPFFFFLPLFSPFFPPALPPLLPQHRPTATRRKGQRDPGPTTSSLLPSPPPPPPNPSTASNASQQRRSDSSAAIPTTSRFLFTLPFSFFFFPSSSPLNGPA